MNPRPRNRLAFGWKLACAALLGSAGGMAAGADAFTEGLSQVRPWLEAHRAGVATDPGPVRLRGVVTFQMPDRRAGFFLHDGTGGIQVFPGTAPPHLPPGTQVEVKGIRRANEYGPYVGEAAVTTLGQGPLPAPEPARLGELSRGLGHGAWVELTATVLDVMVNDADPREGYLWLLAHSGPISCNVAFTEPMERLPEELINARVVVRGVCHTTLNTSARPVGCRILAASNAWMRVIAPASSNRFDRPLRTAHMLRGRPASSDERFLLRGVVTHASPTGWFVLEDETGPLQVERLGPMPVRSERERHVARAPATGPQPGDVVEAVVSHVKNRPMAPVVSWADYRVLRRAELPAPRAVPAARMNDPAHDARRVRIKARVLEQTTHFEAPHHFGVLVLQDGPLRFDAVLGGDQPGQFPVQSGDLVEVTGVCTTRSTAGTARVFLASVADVRVLAAPPAWLTGPAARVALGAAGGLALALAWIWALRRRVALRTAELAASNERLRRNEQALQRALAQEQELHQLKANFVSMVSHEFRTPLGVIVSSTDILRRYLDRLGPEKRAAQFDIIQRSTGTLSGLIEDLLLLGKVEAGKLACQPEPLDMVRLCRHLVDEAGSATQQACPIELSLAGDFTGAVGDESLLRPALTNLLTNAVKYSPPGAPVAFQVTRRNGDAVFMIRDRGIGIPEADQARLFSAFVRGTNVGARSGTGLGLVIARRCVELHGGAIEFESTPGEGTTFRLSVPLFPGSAST